jgi:hypothetical protein
LAINGPVSARGDRSELPGENRGIHQHTGSARYFGYIVRKKKRLALHPGRHRQQSSPKDHGFPESEPSHFPAVKFDKIKIHYLLFKRFFSLPAGKKKILIHTCATAVIMWVALSFFSLQQILRTLQRVATRYANPTQQPLEDIIYATCAIGRRLPLTTCLINGLAGQYLLTRNGYHPTLHIGVKKETDKVLAAHAWVTIDQQVVIGMIDDLDTYTPLPGIK